MEHTVAFMTGFQPRLRRPPLRGKVLRYGTKDCSAARTPARACCYEQNIEWRRIAGAAIGVAASEWRARRRRANCRERRRFSAARNVNSQSELLHNADID